MPILKSCESWLLSLPKYGSDKNQIEKGKYMQLTIRIADEYGEKISLIAKQMGLRKSDIARMALKKFVEESLKNEKDTPYHRVRHVLGIAESGIDDLGQRHREHLMKKIRKD